jgi:hypothetical protein
MTSSEDSLPRGRGIQTGVVASSVQVDGFPVLTWRGASAAPVRTLVIIQE